MPRSGEVVVFKDFFTAGLRIPMDPVVSKLLEPFNVKLHHFTPNGIAALSKFLWVARTFGGGVSVMPFVGCFSCTVSLGRFLWMMMMKRVRCRMGVAPSSLASPTKR